MGKNGCLDTLLFSVSSTNWPLSCLVFSIFTKPVLKNRLFNNGIEEEDSDSDDDDGGGGGGAVRGGCGGAARGSYTRRSALQYTRN
jgi:hypothetical protein